MRILSYPPRQDKPVKNKTSIISTETGADFFHVVTYVSENKAKITVRRFDTPNGWQSSPLLMIDNETFALPTANFSFYQTILTTKTVLVPEETDTPQKIPKIIMQTHESPECNLTAYNSVMTFMDLNPEYEYKFFSAPERRNYIRDFFSELVLEAYDMLVPGAFKADLFRYCWLYKNGGCYFDCKTIPRKPLRQFIRENETLILCSDYDPQNSFDRTTCKGYFNAVMFAVKGNEAIKELIDECVGNILYRKHFFLDSARTNGHADVLNLTGPGLCYRILEPRVPQECIRLKHIIVNRDESSYKNFQILELEDRSLLCTKSHPAVAHTDRYSMLWVEGNIFYRDCRFLGHLKLYVYPHPYQDVFQTEIEGKTLIVRREHPWGLNLRIKIVNTLTSVEEIVIVGRSAELEKRVTITSNGSYSIVMPCKIVNNNLALFSSLAVPSYEKFLDPKNLEAFYLICPEAEIPTFRDLVQGSKLPYKLIAEETLLPKSIQGVQGWYKQQVIKLTMATVVKTDFYLVVDTDMFLNQNFCINSMFHEGKLKYNSEPWPTENSEKFSTNSNWWASSCRLLGYPLEEIQKKTDLMSVTPQVLVVDVVKSLISRLGPAWQVSFCTQKCTEFSLYWLEVLFSGKQILYTSGGFPLWQLDPTTNVLTYGCLPSVIKKAFTDSTSFFTVVQGYLEQDVSPFVQEFNTCLSGPKESRAIFLVASMLKPNRYQSFSTEERLSQIMATGDSIRKRVPGAVSVLIEGTVLNDLQRTAYQQHYDHVLELGADPEIPGYVNNPALIGYGEMKLLERGIDYVIANIPYENARIFKLTSRYLLTDDFCLENFHPDKYNFFARQDSTVGEVYTTGLYSIPPDRLEEFRTFLRTENDSLGKYPMMELFFRIRFEGEKTHLVKKLGVEGWLSYGRAYFRL